MIYNKHNFSIHSLCDKDRDYLGVHVTPEFTEVTNGHYLFRVSTPEIDMDDVPEAPNHPRISPEMISKEDNICDFVIHKDSGKAIENMIPNRHSYLPVLSNTWLGANTNKEQVEFISTDLEIANSKIIRKAEGKYCNTDKIWSDKEIKVSLGFNPDLMLKLCQQLKKMDIKYVKMDIRDENEAIELTGKSIETGQDIRALLMPKKG